MIIYLINIFLICFFGILLSGASQTKRKAFCILASAQWILLSGLRNVSVGVDTYAYEVHFAQTAQTSWGDILSTFTNIMFNGGEGRDPGYSIFEKIIQLITTNYQVYLIIIALLFTVPLGVWIYKNSKEPCMSFLIYSCLFFSFFAITGLRQTIATALVVLIGYHFIKKRQLIPFIILTIIAFTIHKSSIVLFPYYFLYNKKITAKYLGILGGLGILILVLGPTLYGPVVSLFGYQSYLDNPVSGTGTYVFFVVLVMGIGLWRLPYILKNNPDANKIFNAAFIGTLGALMALQVQGFMRFQQYYMLFIMLLVPEIIYSFIPKERDIVFFVGASLLLLLFMRDNPQYLFCWQEITA